MLHSESSPATSHQLLVPIRRLFRCQRHGELDEHGAQMRAIAKQIRGAAPSCEQKSDRREISLRRITDLAGKDEIVAPIISRLASPGRHVVECHRRFGESLTAVGADWTMSSEKPASSFCIGDAASGVRGQLERPVRRTALCPLLSSTGAPTPMRAGPFVIEHFLVYPMRSGTRAGGSMMMMRRTARSGTGAVLLLRPFVAIGRVVKMS